jgi:histidinol-phosphate aminotransferase
MDFENLIKDSIKKFVAFEPIEKQDDESWVRLDTNENAYPPLTEIIEDLKITLTKNPNLNKYPDPLALEVRKAILNQLLGDKETLTDRNTIVIGNSTDEILDTIFKIFVDPGDEVIVFYPSYGMYKVLASLYGAMVKELKLNEDFSIPESAFNVQGKIMFINSPNDPNGKSVQTEIIEKLCNSFSGIVVVDETYADFSKITCLSLLRKIDNLIVCRSFSKAFSLAGLNLGYALSNAKIIKEMNQVKLPYNTNFLAQQAVLSCIKHRKKVFEQNQKIIDERNRVSEELKNYNGIKVMPSDANFIFIKFDDQSITLKFLWDLRELKIMVRHFSKPNLYNFLRMTISTEEENNKFLSAFHEIAKKYL